MIEIRHKQITDTTSTQDAYNRIYRDQGLMQRDSFYLWLIELLKPQPGKYLADISCGEGRLTALAREKGLHALGVDFAFDGVLIGSKDSPASDWVVGDGEALPLAESSLDYVTHIGSLEHYIHPERGVREISRVLKPEGRACILLPNAFGLLGNILNVLRKGDVHDDGQPLQRYGTRNYWESLLAANGLETIKRVGYGEVNFPRTTQDMGWWLSRPKKIIRLALSSLIPLNLTNHFVFICRRV